VIGTKIIEEQRSKYNGNLRVVNSWGLGTYIQANGLTQSGGVVKTLWKQTIRHIKKETKNIKSCLILGLGGGTVAGLISKYWPEARIVGVDIDPLIVEMGKKYLGLDKLNIKIAIEDASKKASKAYDLVIVDLYNGDKFPDKFESIKFLKSLSKNKLVIFNRLYYGEKKIEAEEFRKKLVKIFKKVEVFRPSVNIIFICKA
jgi:spermidine synthase